MHIPRHPDRFVDRHIGPDTRDVVEMLQVLGKGSLDALIDATVPAGIRLKRPLDLPTGLSEYGLLQDRQQIAAKNQVFRTYLGMGYSDTVTPAVIQRNILENPGWYTQYTPYQPEISQGRLEALLNYQTMVIDLTGLPVANASLLDESTAAAEAMSLVHAVKGGDAKAFFVASDCHPQTIEVVRTRAEPLAWRVRRASSTSAARRPPATSAPRRRSSRSSPGCTPSTMARAGSRPSRSTCTASPRFSPPGCASSGSSSGTNTSSTRWRWKRRP